MSEACTTSPPDGENSSEKSAPAPPSELTAPQLEAVWETRRARQGVAGRTSNGGSGQSTFTFLRAAATSEAPMQLGRPGSRSCEACGETLHKVNRAADASVRLWVWEDHDCPEAQAARAAEASRVAEQEAVRAAARRAALADPTSARVREVVGRCRLPHWCPAGVREVAPHPAYGAALDQVLAHVEQWRRGERPARGLWLVGPTNSRKTCLVSALLWEISHWTDRACLLWNVEDLMQQLRRSAQGRTHTWDPSAAESAAVLAIDDLASVTVTDRVWSTLYGLVSSASEAWGQPAPPQRLYLTSNELPMEVSRLLATPDRPDRGARIVRRLTQLCDVVPVGQTPET